MKKQTNAVVFESLEKRALFSATSLRPPAVPLVTSDPYLSIWSESDALAGSTTRHWTGAEQPLVSLIRIDGKTSRLMGQDAAVPVAFPQKSVKVTPTQSVYEFDDGKVHVTMTFMTPALANDRDVLSRPLSYITWKVAAVDGKTHSLQVYDSMGATVAVNTPGQTVQWRKESFSGMTALGVAKDGQTVLGTAGNDTRIDWG